MSGFWKEMIIVIITFVAALWAYKDSTMVPYGHQTTDYAVITQAVITVETGRLCTFLGTRTGGHCYGVSVTLVDGPYVCTYNPYSGTNYEWAQTVLESYPIGHSFRIGISNHVCKADFDFSLWFGLFFISFFILSVVLLPITFVILLFCGYWNDDGRESNRSIVSSVHERKRS
jgi:hypothetical protein